jgi:hypothetical protein
MAIPDKFYRVFNDSSQSQYDDEYGFVAANSSLCLRMFSPRSEQQEDKIIRALHEHLDWANRDTTPFISVYSSKSAAFACANGQLNNGRTGVTVAYIDRGKLSEDYLRKVRKLADELKYEIPDAAWDNSEFEWIVLHRIPTHAVSYLYDFN